MIEENKSLFSIQLTETGSSYILKTSRIVAVILVLFLAIAVVSSSVQFVRLIKDNPFQPSDSGFMYRIVSMLTFLVTVVNVIAVVFYFRFVRSLRRSIRDMNQDGFNGSFRYLFYNALVILTVVILDILSIILLFANGAFFGLSF